MSGRQTCRSEVLDSGGSIDWTKPFDVAFAALPWPMLMLSEDGRVLASSADSGHQRGRFASRIESYLAALRGDPPWLTPQETWCETVRSDGTIACERLILRRAPWGASLVVVPATDTAARPAVDVQTSRLAALGFMVAGVCHEVTNPLTSLHSIVQILRTDTTRSPELLDKGLHNIARNVQRILDISRRLVTFARVGDEPRVRFAVDDAIDEALVVLREQGLWKDIEVRRSRDPGAVVVGSVGQAREIFLNLLINAAHAMAGSGTLVVDTVADGRVVRVDVADTGPGVPPASRDRVFEPFFTTKGEGQGTGLGLAISREIAIEHGGSLDLLDTAGPGATFRVTLPRTT